MRDPYMLVTAKDIPENADLGELLQHPFIRYSAEQQMGRQIEAQLRRVRAIPTKSFEMSTNQALFAMVAATGGWAISPASSVHGTLSHRPAEDLNLRLAPLPFPAFSRSLSLYARKDILSSLPERTAETLRQSLTTVYEGTNSSISLPVTPTVSHAY